MKHIGTFFFLIVSVVVVGKAQTNTQKFTELLNGIVDFTNANVNETRPIPSINLLASHQADTMFFLTKSNIAAVMKEAKKYKNCVISVDRHTIVVVKSWTNCSKSGAWNYCMPYGIGYIQRNTLEKKEDYIKNIIGVPDSQQRAVFLFN